MSTPKTHFAWGYGGILCGRVKGWGWRGITNLPKVVTCKFCLRLIRKDKLDEEYDP